MKGLREKLWGQLTTISLGGCFIETLSPFRTATKLELLIGAYGLELRLAGEVRYSEPRLGMGIMFADMNQVQRDQLQSLISAVSGGYLPGRR